MRNKESFLIIRKVGRVCQADRREDGIIHHRQWLYPHQGKFRGHHPTGNQMRVTGIVIDRIVGGKVVEGWMEMDTHDQMHQLGLIPPPGMPG